MINAQEVKSEKFKEIYFQFLEDFYPDNEISRYYLSDLQKAFDYTLQSVHQNPYFYVVNENQKPTACFALIIDSRLPEGTAQFGFFECIDNFEVFDKLWHVLVEESKRLGVSKIVGPINGTIWHQYRVAKNVESELEFPSEPLSQAPYYKLFKSKNPTREIEYHSAFRKNLDMIIQLTEKSYTDLRTKGITIEKVEKFDLELLKLLHDYSSLVFRSNWNYVPLDFQEFAELYNPSKIENYIGSVYLAKKGNQVIGFCSNIETSDALIMKTIAVLPEFQEQGVGNALTYNVHLDAKNAGKKQVIYALIRKTNKIKYFPKDDVAVFREYSAFEFVI